MGRVSECVAALAASVSRCLFHYISLSLCFSPSLVISKLPSYPANMSVLFSYLQFCVNPFQLQLITSLAHMFSLCPLSTHSDCCVLLAD